MMLTRIKIHIPIVLIAAIFSFSTSCNQNTATTEENVEVITPVTIVPVTYKSVTATFELPASTTFLNRSVVRASTTGTIEKISINPGDYISSGQMLFTIRTRESSAMMNSMQSDSSLSFKGLIKIFSPKDGVINSISYQKGDFVQEGDELAVISEKNSLVFILDVPFELEQYIEKNRKCIISLPDNRKLNANITGKLAEMDMQSQTISYIVKPISSERLPANLIATIKMVKSTSENAFVLPKDAVLGDETQTEFWVMKLIDDSTAVKVIVSKGFENSEEVEITEPKFLPSDRILITGNYGMEDTARVEVVKEY